MKLVFDETVGKYVIDMSAEQGKVETPAAAMAQTAEMEAGGLAATVEKFGNFQVMGVPVGGVVLGTAAAFAIDKIIVDRLIAKETDPEKAASTAMIADLVAAFVIAKYGGKIIGKETAKYCAFVLAYEAVSGKVAAFLDEHWPTSSAPASQAQPLRTHYEVPQVFEQGMRQPMNQFSGMHNTGGALGAYADSF